MAELLKDLAQLLPFPTFVYTDMGAESWTPQLYLGPLDESSDLPTHRAGIDADTVRPVWWIDLDTGTRTIFLDEVTPGPPPANGRSNGADRLQGPDGSSFCREDFGSIKSIGLHASPR